MGKAFEVQINLAQPNSGFAQADMQMAHAHARNRNAMRH